MGIRTKFDQFLSDFMDKSSDLISERYNLDKKIIDDIFDISQSYSDEIGIRFSYQFYYGIYRMEMKENRGSIEMKKLDLSKIKFGEVKNIINAIDKGQCTIRIEMNGNQDLLSNGLMPKFQSMSNRLQNRIKESYPDFSITLSKYTMSIFYILN